MYFTWGYPRAKCAIFAPLHLCNTFFFFKKLHFLNVNALFYCKTAHSRRDESPQSVAGSPTLSWPTDVWTACSAFFLFSDTVRLKSRTRLRLFHIFMRLLSSFWLGKVFVHLCNSFVRLKSNQRIYSAHSSVTCQKKKQKKKTEENDLERGLLLFYIRCKFSKRKCNFVIVFTTIIWFL